MDISTILDSAKASAVGGPAAAVPQTTPANPTPGSGDSQPTPGPSFREALSQKVQGKTSPHARRSRSTAASDASNPPPPAAPNGSTNRADASSAASPSTKASAAADVSATDDAPGDEPVDAPASTDASAAPNQAAVAAQANVAITPATPVDQTNPADTLESELPAASAIANASAGGSPSTDQADQAPADEAAHAGATANATVEVTTAQRPAPPAGHAPSEVLSRLGRPKQASSAARARSAAATQNLATQNLATQNSATTAASGANPAERPAPLDADTDGDSDAAPAVQTAAVTIGDTASATATVTEPADVAVRPVVPAPTRGGDAPPAVSQVGQNAPPAVAKTAESAEATPAVTIQVVQSEAPAPRPVAANTGRPASKAAARTSSGSATGRASNIAAAVVQSTAATTAPVAPPAVPTDSVAATPQLDAASQTVTAVAAGLTPTAGNATNTATTSSQTASANPSEDVPLATTSSGATSVLNELFGAMDAGSGSSAAGAKVGTVVQPDDERETALADLSAAGKPDQPRTDLPGSAEPNFRTEPRSVERTAAVRDAAPPNVDVQHVMGQVARGVEFASSSDAQSVRMRLAPPGLGSLQIDVSMAQGTVTARLEAETSSTHTLLQQNISQLRDALTQQGVTLDRLVVERRSDGSAGPQQGAFNQSTQQQQGGQDQSTQQWFRHDEEAETPVARRPGAARNRTGRLDVQV